MTSTRPDNSKETNLDIIASDDAMPVDLSPEDRLFHEINLLRIEGLYFCHDPKAAAKRVTTQSFIELIKMPEGIVSKPVTIEPHPTYGYPSVLAYKILQAVLKKLSDEGYEGADSASFTQRELARLIGRQSFGGTNSKEFFRAIMQLNRTDIWCSFFEKGTDAWKIVPLTLFINPMFSGRKSQLRECVLTLNPLIAQSLKNRHYFCLNYNRLARLEPIGMALFKHLFFQMSRQYSKLRTQQFTYTRNYEAICSSWLGGLKVLPYRSKILDEQLGAHLKALRALKLIKSYDIVRNDEGGYKLVVEPGAGFFEDYERYYGKNRQLPLPFKRAGEDNAIRRPIELVAYFHKKRLGVEELAEPIFHQKETDFARTLTDKYDDEECRAVIDYCFDRARSGKYDVQTLPGISTYLNDYNVTKEARELKAAERRTREAAKQREVEVERRKEEYAVFRYGQLKRIRERMTPEEVEALEAPIRSEVLTKYSFLKPNSPGFARWVYERGNEILSEQHHIPAFEEWREAPRLD